MQVQSAILFETIEQLYSRVFTAMKPRTVPPTIQVEFCKFANANALISLKEGLLRVRIADVLQTAPAPIQEALAFILIGKLYRKDIGSTFALRYRRYLNRADVRRQLEKIHQQRGRKQMEDPQGKHYNLEEMFEDLNLRFFNGLMARPQLGWSRKASRTMLGHYDPSHHVIVLSKILDQQAVDKLAVEYVLFHEMLHLRHPVDHQGARRCVHTPEFKAAEKQFPRFKEAKAMLRKLP